MRRTLMIITVALALCLCGCSEVPQISDITTEPSQSESLLIKDSEEISQETDAPQSSVNIDTPEESGIASETTVSDVKETESTPQPKEEKKMKYGVGIDISKGKSTVAILSVAGEVIEEPFEITHDLNGCCDVGR